MPKVADMNQGYVSLAANRFDRRLDLVCPSVDHILRMIFRRTSLLWNSDSRVSAAYLPCQRTRFRKTQKKSRPAEFPPRTAFLIVELIYLTLTARLSRLISLPAKLPCPLVGVFYGPADFGIGIVSGVAQLIPLALDVAFYCLEVHIAIF